MMTKRELIFDGNEKQVFATDDSDRVIFRYKDVTLAYNGIKRAIFRGKGSLNNRISALLLGYLNDNGVRTHYIETLNDREQLCRKIETIPLEIIVRNRIAGSLSERLNIEEGFRPSGPILELRYNNDELDDPFINEHIAVALGFVTAGEMNRIRETTEKANRLLSLLCHKAGIELVDIKIEFGRSSVDGEIIISDEISPDTCRLWDEETGEKLDKDRFRHDLGNIVPAYKEVLERLENVLKEDN